MNLGIFEQLKWKFKEPKTETITHHDQNIVLNEIYEKRILENEKKKNREETEKIETKLVPS